LEVKLAFVAFDFDIFLNCCKVPKLPYCYFIQLFTVTSIFWFYCSFNCIILVENTSV
jgi:hypothetical protein